MVVLPTPGGGYAGGGTGDDRELYLSPSEHNFPIYCDSYDIGDVSEKIVALGGMGIKAVVGTGGPGLGGHT